MIEDDIDLERAVRDPAYRRDVIAHLKAQAEGTVPPDRRSAGAADASPEGESGK